MLRNGASRYRLGVTSVVAAIIGAIACGLIAGVRPAGPANRDISPSSVSNDREPLAADAAGPALAAAAAAPAGDLVAVFAKAAGSRAGGAAFGFAMSQLGYGDRTAEQLREIAGQLARIDAQLTTLGATTAEIKERVNEAAFDKMMLDFDKIRGRIESAERNGLREIARAAEDLAKAMESGAGPAEIEKAKGRLKQEQEDFRREGGPAGWKVDTNVVDIASLLRSSSGRSPLLTSYGRTLAQKSRHLTRKHSEELRAFYDYIEQYQALAAIQRAEWQVVRGRSAQAIRESNAEFYSEGGNGARPGWVQTQRATLPDLIPEGVVIDVGRAGDTTLHKTMLFPIGGQDSFPELTTWFDLDAWRDWNTPNAEALRLARQFDGPVAGWKNWRIVDGPQWDSLMEGKKKPDQTGTDYLNAMFMLGDGGRREGFAFPFRADSSVWINHRVERPEIKTTDGRLRFRFTVHRVIRVGQSGSLAADRAELNPGIPRYAPNPRRSDTADRELFAYVAELFKNARARLILVRTTDVNYMAPKSR